MVRRHAFTMIELIFAIVIMSIVIISMPMLMRTNSKAMEANIIQEAIFSTSATIMQNLSYPWDNDSNTSDGSYNKIVAIPNGTVAYNRYYNSQGTHDTNGSFRVGNILENGHRRFHSYTSLDANITSLTTTNPNPLCQKSTVSQFINNGATASGYKNTYETVTTISYIPDINNANAIFVFAATGETTTPTNIKLVTVTIKNYQTQKSLVVLKSYTANIGETDFASRTY